MGNDTIPTGCRFGIPCIGSGGRICEPVPPPRALHRGKTGVSDGRGGIRTGGGDGPRFDLAGGAGASFRAAKAIAGEHGISV
jgi:hypothetical protein